MNSSMFKILVMLVLIQSQANAGKVTIYKDSPPSPEEMGNILFSGDGNGRDPSMSMGGIKTRSISFGKPEAVVETIETGDQADNSVGMPIKFGYNSSEILPESRPFLDVVGKMMNLVYYADEKLLIEGHTDASGSDRYNLYLSEKRAKSVKKYLEDNYQIESERLSVSGKGESIPLPGKSPYDATNRRVQFYQALN